MQCILVDKSPEQANRRGAPVDGQTACESCVRCRCVGNCTVVGHWHVCDNVSIGLACKRSIGKADTINRHRLLKWLSPGLVSEQLFALVHTLPAFSTKKGP